MGTWMDPDGLFRKLGVTKATPNKAGEFRTYGALREVEVVIDLTTLTTTRAIQSDQEFIPAGVRIEEVEVVAEVIATTGTSAALDVGFIRTDRTTVPSNGDTALVNAAAVTTMDAVAEKQVLRIGSTGVGQHVGAVDTANVYYLTACTSTGTFTAGKVVVRVRYMKVI